MSFEIGYALGFRHAVDMMRAMGKQDYYDSWETMLEDCEKVMPPYPKGDKEKDEVSG
jgi:hypothetical protein